MTLYSCLVFWSMMNGINPAVTSAVISVESNGRVMAVGSSHGEIGLMQIRPQFVPETKLQLFNPCTNIMRGTALLRTARKKCKHTIDKTWINCYNLGITGGSRLRHPKKWNYYKKVIARIEQ